MPRYHQTLRFEMKELGEIDMVPTALVAAIGTRLLEPSGTGAGSWLHEPPGQRDLPRILASWQERDLVPRDVAPEFVPRLLQGWRTSLDAVGDWRSSPYTGSADIFGQPSAIALPAGAVQRRHECGTSGHLQARSASLSSSPTRRRAAPSACSTACSMNVSRPGNCGTTSADRR